MSPGIARRSASVLAGCLLTGGLLAGALNGCAVSAPDLGGEAAKQLQSQVLAVTKAAAAEDPAGSLKLLDELEGQLDEAAARGEVSFKRHQSIRTSIDAVRADLTAQQAAAEAARVAAEQEAARVAAEQEAARVAAEQEAARVAAEQEAAAQAAAASAAAASAARTAAEAPVVPAPAGVPPATGDEPDKRKDKGKDKDKDKDKDND
ncbi:MAG: mucin-associated surface protein [Arthrobacter sp.]|nr:mucin-associated surface protein [Arthrobacter sp.]MCU1548841.1 mucin-associated surface protein [Arthrobacter sp.]